MAIARCIRRATAGENPGSVYFALVGVATARLRSGDVALALPLLDEAIALRDKGQPRPPLSVAWAIALRGHVHYRLGHADAGRGDFDRAALGFEAMPAGTWRRATLTLERTVAELPTIPNYDCTAVAKASDDITRDLGSAPLLAQFGRAAASACRLRAGDASAVQALRDSEAALRARLPKQDARLRWLAQFEA